MFLKNIKINNFRSIQKASVDFENGMNILIGKNGAGKSNLLKYINQNVNVNRLLTQARALRSPNVDLQFTIVNDKVEEVEEELVVALKRERILVENDLEVISSIRISKMQNGVSVFNDKEFIIRSPRKEHKTQLQDLRKDIEEFAFFSQKYLTFNLPENNFWLDSPNRFEIDAEFDFLNENIWSSFTFLFRFENNLEIAFINYLHVENEINSIPDITIEKVKELFFEKFLDLKIETSIQQILNENSPISDIRLNSNINVFFVDGKIFIENLTLEFKTNGSWIPWNHLSDGSKRLFYIISECISRQNGSLILIEEPELGIHPHQLFSLMNFLKEQSETKQIIISTHSPIVLDVLPPDELNRITIVKLGDKGTEFHKLNEDQIEKAKLYMSEEGDLSYYWLHSDLEDEE